MNRAIVIAAAVTLWSLPAVAQLINPSGPGGPCYYPAGSTECVPMPRQIPPQRAQPVPLPPAVDSGGNYCEQNCRIEQRACMQRPGDFYRKFADCGERQTICLRGC